MLCFGFVNVCEALISHHDMLSDAKVRKLPTTPKHIQKKLNLTPHLPVKPVPEDGIHQHVIYATGVMPGPTGHPPTERSPITILIHSYTQAIKKTEPRRPRLATIYSREIISTKFEITYSKSSEDILVYRGRVISFSNR